MRTTRQTLPILDRRWLPVPVASTPDVKALLQAASGSMTVAASELACIGCNRVADVAQEGGGNLATLRALP